MMTVGEQLDYDLKVFGICVERELPDGSTERIDPTTIKYKSLSTREIIVIDGVATMDGQCLPDGVYTMNL